MCIIYKICCIKKETQYNLTKLDVKINEYSTHTLDTTIDAKVLSKWIKVLKLRRSSPSISRP